MSEAPGHQLATSAQGHKLDSLDSLAWGMSSSRAGRREPMDKSELKCWVRKETAEGDNILLRRAGASKGTSMRQDAPGRQGGSGLRIDLGTW